MYFGDRAVTAMARTFLALDAHPIGGDIAFRVVYSPPITLRDRIKRRASDMSENENIDDVSFEDPVIPSSELNQNDNQTQDASDNEENVEDGPTNRDEEDEDLQHPNAEDVLTIREINMGLVGLLSLHYPARDVRIPVDGDSAMRILTMFKTRSDARWKDDLDPRWSSAASGWVVLDLQQLLAMSYYPQTPPLERTAIDPH